MLHRKKHSLSFLIILSIFSGTLSAQPTWTFDPFGKEKKPEKYEEKKLASEKTADKKFTTFRRFVQNNVTHYNYYFNANNKINAVIERAKISNKDDYSSLLAFYPYTLDNTASQKTELDSVIYKATAGILLHDLRTDWVDNMYLLIGKSYYFRKELDSAALTFQFINYNLFPRKKREDDNRIVGDNASAQSSTISIANKEKRNVVQKVLTLPPSRNDALIWMARTLTEKGEYGDAASMINILGNDPNLPKRLRNDLEEVNAYWFYKQESYDSAAVHLEKALTNADTKQDRSRWEYLLGQLFEMGGQYDKASDYYAKASKHTVDPVMDIYARLNDAKMFRESGNTKELEKSIARLLKMAKRDRYESYRDIIYYSTGQMSLQKPDTANSKVYFAKSIRYNEANTAYRNKAYLQLADIAYNEKEYRKASAYYDSLVIDDPSLKDVAARINARKNSLSNIVAAINIIEREDSLQRVAAMSPAERDALIKKILKKYRKENGLKEEDNGGSSPITFNNGKSEPADLFEASSSSKGDWYFYNNSLKSRGFSDFKSRWGKRENVDNWRRKSAIGSSAATKGQGLDLNGNIDIDDPLNAKKAAASQTKTVEFTYEALIANLPMNPEMLDSSNNTIARSLIILARLFQDDLEDYKEAINTYENYLQRFPDRLVDGDVYLGLYFCYTKLGNTAKADYYKNLLTSKFAGSNAAKAITDPSFTMNPNDKNPEATKRYAAIYDLFLEGKFTEASEAKKKADSVYGKNYWTPQLLYIEAINYIKQKNDSTAIAVLTNIISLYPTSPLKPKAETMIDVLKRRAEIEAYLAALQITRDEEDKIFLSDNNTIVIQKAPEKKPEVKPIVPAIVNKPVTQPATIQTPPSMISGAFKWDGDAAHFVIMVLDKVDGVYINEAKNAFVRYNREKYYNKPIMINRDTLDAQRSLLVFETFIDADDAVTYYDKIKAAAQTEVSWLQPNKYYFLIISDENLQVLKRGKDVNSYKTLLNNQYPGKF